jgi:hypothetical protein
MDSKRIACIVQSIQHTLYEIFDDLGLKNSLTNCFRAIREEIYEAMDEVGESRDDYHIGIYPFTIERLDGEPIPSPLLNAIMNRLDQKTELDQ